MKLYRSTMFVPGNRPDWIDKAPKYEPDALMIDLEDAVPIAEKNRSSPDCTLRDRTITRTRRGRLCASEWRGYWPDR